VNGWIWGIAAVGVGAGVYLIATKSGKSGSSTSKGIAPGEPNPGGKMCAQVVTMCADGYQAPTPCDCAGHGGVMTIPKAPPVVPTNTGADPIGKWEPQPPQLYEIWGPNPQPINPNEPPHPPSSVTWERQPLPLPIASPDQLANLLRKLPVIADRT
jgi:hypothetical protein